MASPFILTIVIIDCVAALVAITKLIISFVSGENKLIEAVQEESQQKSASLHKKIANSSSPKISTSGQVIHEDVTKSTLENIMQIIPGHKKFCDLRRVPMSDLKLMCKNKAFNDTLKNMDIVFVTDEIIDNVVKTNPVAFGSVNLVGQL